jgi:Mg-chelatase subunit ChlD
MTMKITELDDRISVPEESQGTGCLRTARGNLPLHRLDVRAAITGLVARTRLVQGFHNPYDTALEATYIFPLPDRGAVTAMTMTADGRTVVAELRERAEARQAYEDAIAAGKRASIAEEERPDVFTMRVGNIEPGERVEVALTIVGPLPYEDGEATYRFPLVVAPRYIPGAALAGAPAGGGYAPDTDATPDASRITPPVLLPGFPNPVDLSIEVTIDPAGLPLGEVRSSLHGVSTDGTTLRVQPGERVNRDFILRLPYGDPATASSSLAVHADEGADEGSYQLAVVPPADPGARPAKDVVLLLDRSGSMQGWKMVAARRAAARIVDALAGGDRFAVLTFDSTVERPDGLPAGLAAATDRNRYRAVEHLSRTDARGGTELLEPLRQGLALLRDGDRAGRRARVLVLVTDGQVGNEDQILDATAQGMRDVRVHTVGIDRAVNAGFLGRLATAGGGRCELVESEERLDDAMAAIHRRINAPLVTDVRLAGENLVESTTSPARLPDLFHGVPLVVRGRYRGAAPTLALTGTRADGARWRVEVAPTRSADDAITLVWARAALRDLEDEYVCAPRDELEQRIVATSLRFGVLCRFTAFVAVDSRVVNEGGDVHQVVQPVEMPSGWEMPMMHVAAAAIPMASLASASAEIPSHRHAMRAPATLRTTPLAEPGTGADLATARRVAAEEVQRLDNPPASETERRAALEDLASRLDALVRHLEMAGLDAGALRAVVTMLRDDSIPSAERWAQARRALREFAGARPAVRQFWKRH